MDWAMLAVTAVASIAAISSAGLAIFQARAAAISQRDAIAARDESRQARDESARLAREANTAFVRQAEAQERANFLREAELRPPAWTGPRFISGDLYTMVNSSGRTIYVDSFSVEPDAAEKLVQIRGPEDGLYPNGNGFDYLASQRLSIRPRKLSFMWRYVEEEESHLREFIIAL